MPDQLATGFTELVLLIIRQSSRPQMPVPQENDLMGAKPGPPSFENSSLGSFQNTFDFCHLPSMARNVACAPVPAAYCPGSVGSRTTAAPAGAPMAPSTSAIASATRSRRRLFGERSF